MNTSPAVIQSRLLHFAVGFLISLRISLWRPTLLQYVCLSLIDEAPKGSELLGRISAIRVELLKEVLRCET